MRSSRLVEATKTAAPVTRVLAPKVRAPSVDDSHDAQMRGLLARRALAPSTTRTNTDFGYGDLLVAPASPQPPTEAVAAAGTAGPTSTFPHRATIERSFGRQLDAVAHTDSRAAQAARTLGTHAFTLGRHVGFADANPSTFVAAHEAAHANQNSSVAQAFGGIARATAEPTEAHANAIARRVVRGESAVNLLNAPPHGAAPAVQCFEGDPGADDARQQVKRDSAEPAGDQAAGSAGEPSKSDSARFEGDPKLEKISAGTDKLRKGASGLQITKMQQALVDLGYKLPRYGVDGKFGPETKAALLAFQKDHGMSQSGELDAATMAALNTAYDTRKPYIDNAALDPAHPGTRALSSSDKAAAIAAMVPAKGAGGAPPVFTDEVAGKKYGDEMRSQLDHEIKTLHKELYEDKVGLRADPAKNFHAWSTLEGPAKAAKQVVDSVYATNYGGPLTYPAMSHAGGNLIDQWADEEARNTGKSDAWKQNKATDKVWYLINSNCDDVNEKHGATPSDPVEKTILTPIVADFVATPDKVENPA